VTAVGQTAEQSVLRKSCFKRLSR